MHTLLLCDCAYISVQMGHIRETEVSMESGRHDTNFGADIVIQANQHAHKPVRMHALLLFAYAYISTQMESGRYATHFG